VRLFVAIELDDIARQAVAAEQQRLVRLLGDSAGDWRFVRPAQLHVTLIFLGEVDEARALSIVEAMRHEIDRPAYTMALDGVGMFPRHGAPRVLWLSLVAGVEPTLDVHARIQARLEALGVARDERPLSPHLTLARRRRGRNRLRLDAPSTGGPLAHWEVDRVSLVESRLSPDGARYRTLATACLLRS
jgi:RNA 2',3'-cyclic 3'-phosphodiesterase